MAIDTIDPAGEPAPRREGLPSDTASSVEICGLEIASLRRSEVVDHLFASLARGIGGWLVTSNLDFIQRATRDAEMRALYRKADLSVADGMPLLWAARLQGRPLPERVAGSDLVFSLAERAALDGKSLYLLGGDGDSAVRAAEVLTARYPGLRIVGHSSPWISAPPTADELAPIRDELLRTRPDLVYVAFGSPKQEFLIDALRADVPGVWMMGCGISLSFIAGDVARAPKWVQACGLEWFHRMLQDPRRLVERYLFNNLPFVFKLLLDSFRARRSSAGSPD